MKQDKQALTTALTTSISEVMETMFFLPVDFPGTIPEGELWGPEKDEVMTARLEFDGPFSGTCLFLVPKKAAASIAADFMGMDEETVSTDQVRETVMEIINMIVGSTLSCYNRQAVFNLKIPELVEPGGQDEVVVDSENRIFIVIDTLENHLAFKMIIHP